MYLEEEYYVGFTKCSEIMEMDKNENNTNSVLFHFLASRIYFREARKKKKKKQKDVLYNEQGFRYDKTTIISSCYDSWYLSFLAFDFHP